MSKRRSEGMEGGTEGVDDKLDKKRTRGITRVKTVAKEGSDV